MPIFDTPFKHVPIDIDGPIMPMSERKNRYILTIVDYGTLYPKATALPSIETKRVAEALLEIYNRVGFPVEVLSDFPSNLMRAYFSEATHYNTIPPNLQQLCLKVYWDFKEDPQEIVCGETH